MQSTGIIEGPPGTGKSKTIATRLSRHGTSKKILFVAEKLTALKIVERNVDQAQRDDFFM